MVKKQTEQELLREATRYLQIMETCQNCFFFRSASGGIKTENRFFRTGRKGVQDITCLYKGKFIAIELKTITGKQSPEQKEIERLVKRHGGEYYIIRSLDELKAIIN